MRDETHCCHFIDYLFQLAAMHLLYAPAFRKHSTYHILCYTSCGALLECTSSKYYIKLATINAFVSTYMKTSNEIKFVYLTLTKRCACASPIFLLKSHLSHKNYRRCDDQEENLLPSTNQERFQFIDRIGFYNNIGHRCIKLIIQLNANLCKRNSSCVSYRSQKLISNHEVFEEKH